MGEGHVLKRLEADGEFACDQCQSDINQGCCYYGCEPCDFSLCGGCYVKVATGTQEAPQLTDEDIDRRIAAEVSDLCDHYEMDFRIGQKFIEALIRRRETWENDIHGLWMSLKLARKDSVSGLAMKKISLMNNNMYVYVPPPKELDEMCVKYKLDADATNKLTDLLAKRPDTVVQDIQEVEKRLIGCPNPSSLVMKMIVAMNQGKPMPEAYYRADKGSEKGGKKGDGRGDNRDNRDNRDRSRDRGYNRDRGDRDRRGDRGDRDHRDDRDRDRDRRSGGGDRDREDWSWSDGKSSWKKE